jgi:hypothetical protein
MSLRSGVCLLVLAIILSVGVAKSSWANEFRLFEVGIEGGFDVAGRTDEDFVQVEAFVTYLLPWNLTWGSGWILDTTLNGSAGGLDGGGDTGLIVTLGPGLLLHKEEGRFALFAGVSPTLISRHEYGIEDFGGGFQFTSYIGLSYLFTDHFGIGYRIQHMSNASIYDENPGLDMHMFILKYRF